ncbi:MAG: phospholipid N-methyltransferase [Gemmatimonadota bacterium]
MDRLLEGVDFAEARDLVELGAGTGCVTREILRRMRPDARLVSLEINPAFVERCRSSLPDARLTLVEGCATELRAILERNGVDGADAVISSLPLSILGADAVERILDASRDSLRPGGRFVQYQYSLGLQERLRRRYPRVSLGFTPLNVPPAFVYVCSDTGEVPPPRPRPRTWPSLASVYAAALAVMAEVLKAIQRF